MFTGFKIFICGCHAVFNNTKYFTIIKFLQRNASQNKVTTDFNPCTLTAVLEGLIICNVIYDYVCVCIYNV